MTIKEKQPLKLRHEFKHSINPQDDLILASRLRKLFPHDANADSHGSFRVSSLYFDTPYDKALRQKLDGVNQREKFRLRYYGTDTSFIRMQVVSIPSTLRSTIGTLFWKPPRRKSTAPALW